MRRTFYRSPRTSFPTLIARASRRVQRLAFRPAMELMEARALLSTFVVNTVSDLDRAGGLPVGQESLRQAIEDANADPIPATDTIDFAIPGSGVQVIQPLTDLPLITHPVFIDGYSQPGSNPNTLANGDNAVLLIELDGILDTTSNPTPYTFQSTGLFVSYPASQGGSTVQGLDITRFGLGIEDNVGVCAIQGDFIGTDPTGTVALGNGEGVFSRGLVGTNGDGVNDYAERNVISGNSVIGVDASYSHAVVAGNFIGTDVTGTQPLGNGYGGYPRAGVSASNGARIGADGHDADPVAERNIISGNAAYGVIASGAWVAGNYIGTDVTGTKPVGNGAAAPRGTGVLALSDCRIGTNDDGVGDAYERNVISGNTGFSFGVGEGITLAGSGNVVAGNYIGTDVTGTKALGGDSGVDCPNDGSYDNQIGVDGHDPFPADERNIISGNGTGVHFGAGANHNVVAGNYIGTDVTGSQPLGNTIGIFFQGGDHNRIGTDSDGVGDAAERNIISGNAWSGIRVQDGIGFPTNDNVIAGNYIGTDVTGTQPLGNRGGDVNAGISILGAAVGNLIGVDVNAVVPADGRNVIAGNFGGAIHLQSNDNPGPSAFQGDVVGTVIAGNYIGVDVTGEHIIGGGDITVYNAPSTRIGTDGAGVNDASERNVIADVFISGPAGGDLVAGNYIGTDASGMSPGNTGGGVVLQGVTGAQIGGTGDLGNTIAFSQGAGVSVLSGSSGIAALGNSIFANSAQGVAVSADSTGITLRGNSIFANGKLGIDRGIDGVSPNTPKGPTNFPVLSAAYAGASTVVMGTLNSTPSSTFTIDFYANTTPDPSGYGQGQLYLGSTTVTTDANGNASFTATGLSPASPGRWISATATGPGGDTSEFCQDVQVVKANTVTSLTSSQNPAFFGQSITFTATVGVVAPASGVPTGSVNFLDGPTVIDTATVSGGSASFTTSSLAAGNHTITAVYNGDANDLGSTSNAVNQVVYSTIIVLNPTANGSLTLSGNASIRIPGAVVVDSTSSTALSASGNAQLTASVIDIAGGFQKTGSATISPAPATGVSVADPLGNLGTPSPTGLINYGSVSFTTGTHTLSPGIYSQINVSGNASLTLSAGSGGTPGIYIIEGGGLTVTGGASISGQNVFLYNTGSNYPGSGGNFGGITLSGTGTFALTAPASGPDAGVVIFQSRANTRALSFSGNALAGLSGIIYAPSALLSFSGNSQLQAALDVGMLSLSGNISLTQIAAGSDGTGDVSGIANTLLAGNLSVSINDPSGLFTADERARIQDAIHAWDAILAPYSVTITAVSDPSQANLVIDTGTTSACGSAANGVLGCYNAPKAEITMLQGWNWYAGSDPSQIGAGQYDFETTVLHELGHALGLGGSTSPSSPMYEVLAAGVADRTPTAQDLKIPDPPAGADPQMAAGFVSDSAALPASPNVRAAAPVAVGIPGPAGFLPLPSPSGQWSAVSGQWPAAGVPTSFPVGPETTLVVQGLDRDPGRDLSLAGDDDGRVFDSVLADLVTDADRSPGADAHRTRGGRGLPGAGDAADGTGPEAIRPDRNDPIESARPAGLPVRVRPVERGVIRWVSFSDEVLNELAAAAVGLAGHRPVPADPIARPETPPEAGKGVAKLAATLIVAGSWGHRARFRGVTSRPAGRSRSRKDWE